jgi:ferrochelatase
MTIMTKTKRAVIIINLGSPKSYKVRDVRSFLKQFLNDPCVIDIHHWLRYILVNGIIAPFRSFRSSKLYAQLSTERGFPLIYHSQDLLIALKESEPPDMAVYLAMRYGVPSLKETLTQLEDSGCNELLCIPLFPQFASSTTGSIIRYLKNELKETGLYNRTSIIPYFHHIDRFIDIWKRKISGYDVASYNAIVFSYHGVPIRQTERAHPGRQCESLGCEHTYHEDNAFCYRAACHQTTRSITDKLGLAPEKIYTSFQSRFGKHWLRPFTDQTLKELAAQGKKKVLILSPAFVADCLETEIEIGMEYAEFFHEAGGIELNLVPSLNSDRCWADFLSFLIEKSKEYSVALDQTHCYTGMASSE